MNPKSEQKFIVSWCTLCTNIFSFFNEKFMQFVKVGEKVSGLSMNFHDILYSKKCNAHELIDSRCLQMEIFTHKVSCQCVIV